MASGDSGPADLTEFPDASPTAGDKTLEPLRAFQFHGRSPTEGDFSTPFCEFSISALRHQIEAKGNPIPALGGGRRARMSNMRPIRCVFWWRV